MNSDEVKTIRIKYYPDSPHLEQTKNGDWIDCYTYTDVTMQPGDFMYIPLGFACQLPEGYEGYLEPRSSTFKRYGLQMANEMGIFDETFCGDGDQWMFPAYATRAITIPKGTRICQFRIQKHQPTIIFQEVETLGNEDRGGWGSSGV